MALGEDSLKLLVQISNFTEEVTGIRIVDAYFGLKKLSLEKHAPPTHVHPDHEKLRF